MDGFGRCPALGAYTARGNVSDVLCRLRFESVPFAARGGLSSQDKRRSPGSRISTRQDQYVGRLPVKDRLKFLRLAARGLAMWWDSKVPSDQDRPAQPQRFQYRLVHCEIPKTLTDLIQTWAREGWRVHTLIAHPGFYVLFERDVMIQP